MPIFIKNFDWDQTNSKIIINIPIENLTIKNLDIFTSTNYIKVRHGAHLCEIFLHGCVEERASRCEVLEGQLVLTLHKLGGAESWPGLQVHLTKEEQASRREQALESTQQAARERSHRLTEQQDGLHKLGIEEQMKINDRERVQIAENRQSVINSALREMCREQGTEKPPHPDSSEGSSSSSVAASSPAQWPETAAPNFSNQGTGERAKTRRSLEGVKIFPPPKPPVTPPPRDMVEIDVSFTPRKFPTPKRESRDEDEQKWLQNQMEARKSAGYSAQDCKPEETDFQWIKDKADSFLRAGNFLGAEAAYSHAISLGFRVPALFCNRAAAHLALGNLHKAVEDASQGLELLTPPTPSNAKSRARCHARRGAALCKLGSASLALPDLRAALELCPQDQGLRVDLTRAQRQAQLEDNTDSSDSQESP